MFFADFPILGNEKSLPLYLENMGQQHCQDHLIRPEGYHYDQILYCTKGSGTLVFNGKSTTIPPDTAIFIPAGIPHEYYPEEDIWDIHWIVERASSGSSCRTGGPRIAGSICEL